MASEKRTSLLIEPKPAIDEDLWEDFYGMEKAAEPLYSALKLPAEELAAARLRFLASGRTENPDLRVTTKPALNFNEGAWLALKERIKRDAGRDMLVRQAYIWRINEAIAGVRMIEASRRGDMRRFGAYNQYVYGRPDPEIFAGVTDWFRHWAKQYLESENPAIREAAKEVMAQVPDMKGDRDVLTPSDEVFRATRDQLFKEDGYFALALAGVNLPPDGKITPELGDPALRQVLNNIGAERVAIEDAGGPGWSNDNYRDKFKRPAKYGLSLERFLGLPVRHEAGHRLEYENGLRQELKLFGGGLDRYEKGNEGRAVLGEALPYESFEDFTKQLRWQELLRRSLAISLGVGLAGQPKDFCRTFAIINSIDRLWLRLNSPDDIDEADKKADARTWNLLAEKVFCGTDGKGGNVYRKNNYLEYSVNVWRVAEEHPELIEQGDLGKFDITNPRHIELAQAFNVLPIEE